MTLAKAIESNKELSETSKKNYLAKIKKLSDRAGADLQHILTNPDTFVPKIKEWYPNETSHKAFFGTILSVFRYNPDFKAKHATGAASWATAFRAADESVNQRYETNKPSDKQSAGYVPYGEIIDARNLLPAGHIHRLLLGCYTYIHPLRGEFCRVAVYRGKLPTPKSAIEPNYIHITGDDSEAKLVIRQFKTQKHHDSLDIPLPEPFIQDVVLSLAETPRSYLFENTKGKPYVQAQFSKWTTRVFQSIFKRPLTISLIRHSFINELDFNTLSIVDKKQIAQSMGHTVEMQDKYRLLFTDKSSECDCVCKGKT